MTTERHEVHVPVEGAILAADSHAPGRRAVLSPLPSACTPTARTTSSGACSSPLGCVLPKMASRPCLSTCAATGHLQVSRQSATTSAESRAKILPTWSSGSPPSRGATGE